MTKRTLPTAMLVLAATRAGGAAPGPEVKTRSGTVRGTTTADGRIRVFRGIPYAGSTAGDFRWKEPRPAATWQGVRDATQYGPQCVQGPVFADIKFPGPPSEDCLSLN